MNSSSKKAQKKVSLDDKKPLSGIKKMISEINFDDFDITSKFLKVFSYWDESDLVISSIGEANLGKSNLLNELFNSDFKLKSFNSENQATDYFDIRNLDDKRIVDFEGLDSINNDSRKEGIIFSLSFAISDIVLLHILYI